MPMNQVRAEWFIFPDEPTTVYAKSGENDLRVVARTNDREDAARIVAMYGRYGDVRQLLHAARTYLSVIQGDMSLEADGLRAAIRRMEAR